MHRQIIRTGVALMVLLAAAQAAQAQIITNVAETGGDNETTDTIPAKWTGQSFPVSVANEPFPGAVIGENYTVPAFGDGAPSYVDRAHRYASHTASGTPLIPAYLLGGEYIMSGNDNRDNPSYRLDVTVATPVTAYMLIDNRLGGNAADPPTFGATTMQWILDQGWLPTANGMNRTANPGAPDEVGIDEASDGTINNWFSVYQKTFPAGTFNLFQPDNAGQNMYGVVIVPEPSGVALACGVAGLGLLKRRRSASR